MMDKSSIADILTSFSPYLDYFAISSGDGRIKIFDALRGQLQTEFSNLGSNETSLSASLANGHLSVDYTCMKWISIDKKKKRKLDNAFLVLGTGSGDILALEVSTGQLRWTLNDCHPGGAHAVLFSSNQLCIFTAGSDGTVCRIDPHAGNICRRFKASTMSISCICLSPDENMLATAASQIKVFSCDNFNKLHKYSGHSGNVLCMVFTGDGKYILSCGSGERFIAIWDTGGFKKRSARNILAMEHPAVFIDSKCFGKEGSDCANLYILALSEVGKCYIWHGNGINELAGNAPTKVLVSGEDSSMNTTRPPPAILLAKLQGFVDSNSMHIFVACGLMTRPSFHKILIHPGVDVKLDVSQGGVLLPSSSSRIDSRKGTHDRAITALDRSNVEDALFPIPRLSALSEKKMESSSVGIAQQYQADSNGNYKKSAGGKDSLVLDTTSTSFEKKLRHLKILCDDDVHHRSDHSSLWDIDLETHDSKQMRARVSSLEQHQAYQLLEILVAKWKSRSVGGKYVLQWIECLLMNQGHSFTVLEKGKLQLLNDLAEAAGSIANALQPLLQLSGRLQLVTAQINKDTFISSNNVISGQDHDTDEDENADADDTIVNFEDDDLMSNSGDETPTQSP